MANLPSAANSGFIKIISTGRSLFVNSTYPFFPNPRIDGFTPNTGISGNIVLISGANFSGATSVKLNDINLVSFAVIHNTGITGMLPSGYLRGSFFIQGTSGTATYSRNKFLPSQVISGIDPISGLNGGILRVSGYDYQSGKMYQSSNGSFKINIGGREAKFSSF